MALGALPPMVAGTGAEFGGDDRGQDGSLEDPGVLAQPEKALSPAEADVNASIEHQRLGNNSEQDHLPCVKLPSDSWGFTPLPLPEQRPATANHSDIHALIGVADALVLIG